MQTPKISIIIPVYNRELLIVETFFSIKNQTYSNFECLFIDDGSTDNSFLKLNELIANDNRFKAFERSDQFSKGPSGCRNMGIGKATGDFVQFFDSDDLMHEKHLELKIEEATSQNADLVVCQLLEFYSDKPEEKFGLNKIDDNGDLINHLNGNADYYMPCPMWRYELIKNSNFKEGLHIFEDLIFNLENRIQAKKIVLIYQPLIYYRRHRESSTGIQNNNINMLMSKIRAWDEIYKILSNFSNKNRLKEILFFKNYLNLYFILINRNIKNIIIQLKSLFGFITNCRTLKYFTKLIVLIPITFLVKKGYNLYHVK